MKIELRILKEELSIAKLNSIQNIDEIDSRSSFFALIKADGEITLVTDSQNMPENQYVNEGWNAIKMVGPLDFSLVGILQKVIQPLSENGISVFTISTFDTDYVLIKKEQMEEAVRVLKEKFIIK